MNLSYDLNRLGELLDRAPGTYTRLVLEELLERKAAAATSGADLGLEGATA